MEPGIRFPLAKVNPATYLSSMLGAPRVELFQRAIKYLRSDAGQAAP